jgi:hypothetical protein
MISRKFLTLVSIAALAAAAAFGFGSAAVAQEDLTDNATCLECHADEPRAAPEGSDRPRVHTDEGGFAVEDHEAWSCVDCHDSVTELPHPDSYTGGEVNCENCHETTPTAN